MVGFNDREPENQRGGSDPSNEPASKQFLLLLIGARSFTDAMKIVTSACRTSKETTTEKMMSKVGIILHA
jgi:hypothetical protein